MEVEESYDVLFKDWNHESLMKILPQVRKCIVESQCEKEVLRALELAFDFCLKNITEVQDELFQNACKTSKRIIENKLKIIEKNPASCVECLGVSLQILSFLQRVFEVLNEKHRIKIVEVKNFLIITSEVVFCCLSHCKMSEQVYGNLLSSLAEHLSNFFKRCCALLEHLLTFIAREVKCEPDDENEIDLFDKIMSFLSKSGIVLINLEIKTMAKVWKACAFLTENHSCLREHYNIDETLKDMCCCIIANMETLCDDGQDFEKMIKLNCFLLKVVIKFCTIYAGSLKSCYNSLLNLLLMLCRWDAVIKTQPKFSSKQFQDLLKQLTVGSEPLLSLLMRDKLFVEEFDKISCKSVELPILCCLVLRKLIDGDLEMRSLWFSQKENVLVWVFSSASSCEFLTTSVSLPNIMINGKQTKFTDLYEYVLVNTSAFLMTATADEYQILERLLIKNILQTNPIRALLATDIWCILARFTGSELCLLQIFTLSKLLQEMLGTSRVEKYYLMSLIRRLFLLLSESHRELFFKSFSSSFYSALWGGCCIDSLSQSESSHVRECVLSGVDHVLDESSKSEICKITHLWKFNCEVLASGVETEKFLRILCGLTASLVPDLPPEDLFLVLSQIKKLLTTGQPTCIQLYFTHVIKSLSTVFITPGNFQKRIITTIAEIFRILLSSKQILAKQRAFETFYTFSHVTSHGEVISLSVQDSPELKTEVTHFFKKTPVNFDLNYYFNELYKIKFEHICVELGVLEENTKIGCEDWKKIVARWKEDGKQIIECFRLLSETEKMQVKNICQSILCLRGPFSLTTETPPKDSTM